MYVLSDLSARQKILQIIDIAFTCKVLEQGPSVSKSNTKVRKRSQLKQPFNFLLVSFLCMYY